MRGGADRISCFSLTDPFSLLEQAVWRNYKCLQYWNISDRHRRISSVETRSRVQFVYSNTKCEYIITSRNGRAKFPPSSALNTNWVCACRWRQSASLCVCVSTDWTESLTVCPSFFTDQILKLVLISAVWFPCLALLLDSSKCSH